MKRKILKNLILIVLSVFIMISYTGCYSIFSGGTGGLIVDSESTANPKMGIANVDVYAYVDSDDRNKDFNSWKEGKNFSPSAAYYGHTTTASDGSFRISKLVWKSAAPEFGKDGDYRKIYLLFYHENYGLTKGETVIISDSYSETVYAELTAVRKTTALNLNFVDVANNTRTGNSLYVEVKVPQTTEKNPDAASKIYKGTVTGNGTMLISYPRWTSAANKAAGIENTPDVEISYVQNSDEITWKGCKNQSDDYSFICDENGKTVVEKTVSSSNYTVNLYGKATKFNVPSVNGKCGETNGVEIIMKKAGTEIELGHVTTRAQTIGTAGTEKNGVFSGLGEGSTWTDTEYTGRYSSIDVDIFAGGSKKATITLKSDETNHTVEF